MVVLLRIAFRPNKRKRTAGDVLTNMLTIPDAIPGGAIAGASAIKTSTFSFKLGCIERVANAWAVPCEKPTYERDFCLVVLRI